ncbi:hypothetical protein [Nocardioides limicola]|uniref:hypothetical protein n=1 Tax=Nocardioides limicola TaxID=2803368 RepID=UPI00193B26C2|nr:hypothetical protein [Nocardioides sp. DJM-14]
MLWSVLVTPPVGVVHEGTVWQSGLSSQSEFGVTGWYLLLGFGVAVVLGGVLAWRLVDHEYAVLIGLILGSVAAALLASAVGAALGPASPEALAAGLPDGTEVEINLAVHPLAWVSWPIGALMAAMVVWLSFPTPSRRHD